MKRATHAFVGFSAGLLASLASGIPPAAGGGMGALGSLLPDLDLKWGHRKALHNLVAPSLFWASLAAALDSAGAAPLPAGLASTLPVFAGWLSHVLLDSATARGVALLFPLSSRRLALGRLRTGDPRAEALGALAGLLMLLAYYLAAGPKGV